MQGGFFTSEVERQKLVDTNEIGFYVNSRMGLSFNQSTLDELLRCSDKFPNAVFLVYDIYKSNYGLQPLHAYRLSQKALDTLPKEKTEKGENSSILL